MAELETDQVDDSKLVLPSVKLESVEVKSLEEDETEVYKQ